MKSTTPPEPELAVARETLLAFLQAFMERDYAEALEHTQVTWRTNPHNPTADVGLVLSGIMPDYFKVTEVWCSGGEGDDIPEVFSDCMVDFSYRVTGVSEDAELIVEGKARVICETSYMHPSPEGSWGVNPTSLTRVRVATLPVV